MDLDLGLTDWDQEGLLRHKRKYATDERTITFLRHEPSPSSSPEGNDGDLVTTLTQLFTDERVPDDVTESAGGVLYSLFA